MKDKPPTVPTPDEPTRFPLPPAAAPAPPPAGGDPKRGARLRQADRQQLAWGRIDLEAQLPDEHPARAIWAVIERLDRSGLYAQIEARDEVAGAPAIDPQILLALWGYATSDGEGRARAIWRLTEMHAAYRWIRGGVAIGYHTLSDFRRQQGEGLNALITQVLALLLGQARVDLRRVAQDGTRVRARAGASSFRRGQTLEARMQQAREHREAVTREAADPGVSARQAAARKRGAAQRIERLEAALAQSPEVTEIKKRSGAKDATGRVSTTDPDARVMKMGDGGVRPACNVQFSSTTDRARVIVGVDVINRGSDAGQRTPMLAQVEQRTGVRPDTRLVDGGYAQHDAIDAAAEKQVTVYAPVPKPRKNDTRDPHTPLQDDSAAVAAWRQRMGTDQAQEIYKQRAATAETVNADAKPHRGLNGFSVRGLDKALGSAALFALSYNILRTITLGG